jgi:hypothetical protein
LQRGGVATALIQQALFRAGYFSTQGPHRGHAFLAFALLYCCNHAIHVALDNIGDIAAQLDDRVDGGDQPLLL